MKLSLAGYLLIALVLVAGWGGFATYRWATASARCDARMADARADGEAQAREHYRRALQVSAGLAATERAVTASALSAAAGNTADRGVQIIRVPVTGACIMPAGLPSLQPAVQEARDAARD